MMPVLVLLGVASLALSALGATGRADRLLRIGMFTLVLLASAVVPALHLTHLFTGEVSE